jgi:hypothetical protein
METLKSYLISLWAKAVASVKSAPMTFAYGVAAGLLIGWVL